MRARQQIDPKTLRKHSRIVEKRQDPVVVAGDKAQTDFGYTIDGYKGKLFETKFVCIMPSSMTPKWQHEKKTRVLRVVGGVGHYETFTEAGETTVRPVTFGDEVVIEPGTTYRIRSSPSKLEFFVTQESKYESTLKELAPAESVAQVPAEELQSVTQEDKTHQQAVVMNIRRASRNNLAREQIASMRGQASVEARRGPRSSQSEETFFRNGAGEGLNAMPVANFDPDGAG